MIMSPTCDAHACKLCSFPIRPANILNSKMPFQVLLYVGAGAGSIGFAIGALVFLAWALIGARGEQRARRLRFALSSAALFVASVLSAVAMFQLVLLPSTMQVTAPEFTAPWQGSSAALAMAIVVTLYVSAFLLIRAMFRLKGTRRTAFLTSLGVLLLTPPLYAADYLLIYRVHVPAYEQYVLIDSRSHDWKTHVGDLAPDISVEMIDGATKQLSDFHGKLVVLNFFATWCGPCNKELPHLQALWNDLKSSDGIQILVVDREETQDVVSAFLAERGFTFPVALDPTADAFKAFAKEGIPRTYLIGRDGKILFQTMGFSDDMPFYQRQLATLRSLIDQELASNR